MADLGKNQKSVLHSLQQAGHWYAGCGWVWTNRSTTERILDSLVKRGLAVRTERPASRPGPYGGQWMFVRYDITDEGRRINTLR